MYKYLFIGPLYITELPVAVRIFDPFCFKASFVFMNVIIFKLIFFYIMPIFFNNSLKTKKKDRLSRLVIKPTKRHVRPAKTLISLGICPGWSESLLCAQWVAKDPRFLHADSEDSDQTGRMPRLIWVFAGRTTTLLVLSRGGSFLPMQSSADGIFMMSCITWLIKLSLKHYFPHLTCDTTGPTDPFPSKDASKRQIGD